MRLERRSRHGAGLMAIALGVGVACQQSEPAPTFPAITSTGGVAPSECSTIRCPVAAEGTWDTWLRTEIRLVALNTPWDTISTDLYATTAVDVWFELYCPRCGAGEVHPLPSQHAGTTSLGYPQTGFSSLLLEASDEGYVPGSTTRALPLTDGVPDPLVHDGVTAVWTVDPGTPDEFCIVTGCDVNGMVLQRGCFSLAWRDQD